MTATEQKGQPEMILRLTQAFTELKPYFPQGIGFVTLKNQDMPHAHNLALSVNPSCVQFKPKTPNDIRFLAELVSVPGINYSIHLPSYTLTSSGNIQDLLLLQQIIDNSQGRYITTTTHLPELDSGQVIDENGIWISSSFSGAIVEDFTKLLRHSHSGHQILTFENDDDVGVTSPLLGSRPEHLLTFMAQLTKQLDRSEATVGTNLGITFDIGHAMRDIAKTGIPPGKGLEDWFSKLGHHIKTIHLHYADSTSAHLPLKIEQQELWQQIRYLINTFCPQAAVVFELRKIEDLVESAENLLKFWKVS